MDSRPRIRTLGPGRDEREAVLELLDGWPFDDGRRGRDFFRRYFEHDPCFVPENVWIAEEGGRPVACAQVFPRRLRVAKPPGRTLPIGGIGSVFTAPGHRRRGLATELLKAALAQMVERGMVLSLLLATRLDWYRRLGFEPWSNERWRLRATDDASGSVGRSLAIAPFAAADLEEVSALGDRYARQRPGTAARTPDEWRASLDLAGDPDEDFSVARRSGRIVAYLRCADLDGRWQALEWGRELEGAERGCGSERTAGVSTAALAELFAEALRRAPREEGRGLGLLPFPDSALEETLAARGLVMERDPWTGSGPPPTWMMRCLAPRSLARHLGRETPPDESPTDLLQRVLPRERFGFWPADRF